MSDKNPKASVILHFSKGSYLPGEFIKGSIEINTNIAAIIQGILIEIFQIEDWKNGTEDKNFVKRKIVSFKLNLKNNKNIKFIDDNNIILSEGITFLPFNFRFSEYTCPCFEHPHPDYRSFIRYSFCASILSSNINGTINYPLCLLSRAVIDPEKKLSDSIDQHIMKWKIFDAGSTRLRASIPQNNFKYDSICRLSIEIDNRYGDLPTKEYKVGLRRILYFKDKKGEVQCRYKKQMVREKVPAVVKPRQINNYTFDLILKETDLNTKYNYNLALNPYNIPIEKINYFMPSVNGNIIKCEYNIKVSLYFESFVDKSHRPRVRLPLYIVHQLPNDNKLEPQDSIEFINKKKNNLNKNNNNTNKNANKSNSNKSNNNKNNKNNISKSYNTNVNKNTSNKIINNNTQNKNLNYSANQNQYANNNINDNYGERESVALPTLEAIEEASEMKKLEEQRQKEEMNKKILEEENRILNNIKNNSQNNNIIINNNGDTEPENCNIICDNNDNNNNINSENDNDFYDKLADEDEEPEKIEVNPRYSSLAAPLAFGAEDKKDKKNKNNENDDNLYPVFEDDEYKKYEYQNPINIYDNENDI